ncbi:hypothetical protein BGX28_009548 [Mortierella sp. GBA30]|nr:hypothetical protein BGX28_009548 [Mortierella sp. GBA30]
MANADSQSTSVSISTSIFGTSLITFDSVQELVVLVDIQDFNIFLHVRTEILRALKDNRLLSSIPLQGLAVILDYLPDDIDLSSLHGTFVEILNTLHAYLRDIRTVNNDRQLLPLLTAINSLLDAMVCRGVSGIDLIAVYDALRSYLGSLTSHANVKICFLALYAKQDLAVIGNDESLPMGIVRRGKLVFSLVGGIWKVATNLDLSSTLPRSRQAYIELDNVLV